MLKNISIFNHHGYLSVIALGLVVLLMGIMHSNNSAATTENEETKHIPTYMITTRILTNPNYEGVLGKGYNNSYPLLNISQLLTPQTCHNEVAIFVHGWDANETKAKEMLDRVKLSLENKSHFLPLVGFSWPSDTAWYGAKFIAKENGPKLAKFILELKKNCPGTDIRIIAHSLGARVVLSSLDSLNKSFTGNTNNFKVESVHLMAAAVDNEEVSTNPEDILKDQANWGTAKSDYGRAIEGEVVHFYNLYSTKDKMLAPDPKKPYSPYQIYPSAEADSALGQGGYQKDPDTILILTGDLSVLKSLPQNYNEKNVTDQILAICDANADKKPDLPFFPGKIIGIGDNHGGYMGFRDIANKSKLIDAGAMDIVVHDWDNKTIIDNNENLNSAVKCK